MCVTSNNYTIFEIQDGRKPVDMVTMHNDVEVKRFLQEAEIIYLRYCGRREYLEYLASYRFLLPPTGGFPRESSVEKVFGIPDLNRYISKFM